MSKDNLSELEARAKQNASKQIAELFQRPEQLDAIDQVQKRYLRMKIANEAQLKMAMHSQLDGVRIGLDKLDSALTESQRIHENMNGLATHLSQLSGLSTGLGELRTYCNKYNQLAAAMENMKHIVRVPDSVQQATQFIASENLLEGHKLIQELEGTRDELMFEVFRQNPNSPDLDVLRRYFRDLDDLNEEMVKQIKILATRVPSASVTQNTYVVTCVRIIDREERADEIWLQRQINTNFIPDGRPKRWKDKFFEKLNEYIRHRVLESALDDDDAKQKLVRHNENIRKNTLDDLRIAKNICPTYFPKKFRIFERFVEMYHDAIGENLEVLTSENLSEAQIFEVLGWMNAYHGPTFMGDPALHIDMSKLNLRYPVNLLPQSKLETIRNEYIDILLRRLRSTMTNLLLADAKDWRRIEAVPDLDGSSYYYTTIPKILFAPLVEMIGTGVFRYVGNDVNVIFIGLFIDELVNFAQQYVRELKAYRDEYVQDRSLYPAFIEYILANANNCFKVVTAFEETLEQESRKCPAIKTRTDPKMAELKAKYQMVINTCIEYAMDVIFMDLFTVMNKIMTKEWDSADYLTGTLEDYNSNALIHLRPAFQDTILPKIAQRLCVEYIKALLTRKMSISTMEERRRVGERIDSDGLKLKVFFESILANKTDADHFEALCLIAQILINNDISMLPLDVMNMQRKFPDVRKEQLYALLLLRGDMRSGDAKDMAADYKYDSSKPTVFTKVAVAMGSQP